MVLPLLAIAAVASAGIGAIGQVLGGVSAKKAAKQEAKIHEANAAMARAEGGVNAQLALSEANRTLGRAATLAAASGGGLTGSAVDVLDDLSMQGIFNAQRVTYEAESDARAELMGAQAAKMRGKAALTTSIFQAGSTLLGGAVSAAQARRGA